VREIGWSHNLAILERCKDPLEREFYLGMTRKFGWSKNVVIHQIDNQSYEKSLLGQTNFDQTLTPELCAQAKLAVKDEYTFDFLELGEGHSERELEPALIARIEDLLRAMGGRLAFMGSQYRLGIDGEEFFIDLLLLHRRLRCLVVIDLKKERPPSQELYSSKTRFGRNKGCAPHSLPASSSITSADKPRSYGQTRAVAPRDLRASHHGSRQFPAP
jgi:predicted nuclease of restriction endonuclease-like (RecB) superfamily